MEKSTFEKFCEARNWKLYRIPELPGIKTPDYFVIANNKPFIVEEKVLTESGPERKDIEWIPLGIGDDKKMKFADLNKDLDSIRRKIEEAEGQFRCTSLFKIPQVIILFCERRFIITEEILFQACYGKIFQRIGIKFERKGELIPKKIAPLITDRTFRRDKNNTISAVATPINKGMFVVHNIWANILLPVDIFNSPEDKQCVQDEIKFKII
jgi:hypothetical protein